MGLWQINTPALSETIESFRRLSGAFRAAGESYIGQMAMVIAAMERVGEDLLAPDMARHRPDDPQW